ncbi:MAG: hypothetical protein MI717_07920 [Spirochaetales bacterium]|nr:hypothetical protein [Spirochaetales bacterium]
MAYDVSGVLSDQSEYVLGRPETFEGRTIIDDLRGTLGDMMAAPADQIAVNDLAVHGATPLFGRAPWRRRTPACLRTAR